MSDERQKYRSVLLDQHSSDDNFRSELIEVTVGDTTLDVLVRALQMGEFQNPYVPDSLIEEIGAQEATKLTLVTLCARTPDGDRIYNPPKSEDNPGDVHQITDGPMYGNGPVERIFQAVNYVHGFTATPPKGITDPRLEEIAEAAEHLQEIAKAADDEDEGLSAAEVDDMAELIAGRVRYIDHGSTSGK